MQVTVVAAIELWSWPCLTVRGSRVKCLRLDGTTMAKSAPMSPGTEAQVLAGSHTDLAPVRLEGECKLN